MSHSAFLDTISASDLLADFEAAAREWPDLPAIMDHGSTITYQELAVRVSRAAARCRARGYGSDGPFSMAGTLVTHTPAAVENMLGILKAGAAYCPIDATLPTARKQALISLLGLNRLVAVAQDAQSPSNDRVESIGEEPEVGYAALPQSSWRQSDPAYVLCTSGSSGVPKPVTVSRAALTATVRALRDLFELTPNDRVLQFASLGWDTCLEEILPALTAGATLVFDDAAHSHVFPRFLRMLADRQITVVDLPTAFWLELVHFLHEEQAVLPETLRLVVIGGERVDPTRLRQWRELDVKHIRLLNTYGCTETTMVTHAVQLSGPGTEEIVAGCDARVPLGRPLPHIRDHVTPDGELLVSGVSLADGYLGAPELTADAFPIADYGSGPTRWFRTGDLVSRGESGLLYSHGRADEQVKVLGVRVHPAEVEAQLNSHPAVEGCVVVGERRLGHMGLTAYVAAVEATTPKELRNYLRERLPSQFVPSRVKFVPGLAYTASGKVDRAAMRRAETDHDCRGACR